MATSPEDWVAVLDRLLAGDREAFLKINRLLTRFLVQLRAYDFRDEWEDLRQEVLLCVVANARAGKLRDPRALVGYMRIITRNKFMDRLKIQLRLRGKETRAWDEDTARLVAGTMSAACTGEDAVDAWAEARNLPLDHRRVLDGVYRQGKTYQQVADETGLPLGTMKRRLREALATLRQRLVGSSQEE